jgi:hypothetical protein
MANTSNGRKWISVKLRASTFRLLCHVISSYKHYYDLNARKVEVIIQLYLLSYLDLLDTNIPPKGLFQRWSKK